MFQFVFTSLKPCYLQVVMLKSDGTSSTQPLPEASIEANQGIITLPTQLSLQSLQGNSLAGFAVNGEAGQQVLIVTDPSQLEILQVC